MGIVEAQIKASIDATEVKPGHPAGWIEPSEITSSLDLLKTDEKIGTPRPAKDFFTDDLLPKKSGS